MPSSRIRIPAFVIVTGAFCVCVSCGANYPTHPGTAPEIIDLQVQFPQTTPDPRVGTAVSLLAYSVDADGAWTDVTSETTWYAADSSILRTSNGSNTLLAVGIGETNIIASYEGLTTALPMTVLPQSSFPRLEFVSLSGPLRVGTTGQVTLERQELVGLGVRVTAQATWTSSDPTVVTAPVPNDTSARFRAVSTGTSRITASIGGLSYSFRVSVTPRR